MDFNKDWRKNLQKLPPWALSAIDRLGKPYDYITYRLSDNIYNFIEIMDQLENELPGTSDPNCSVQLNAFQQREVFFIQAIRHADYYRPASLEVLNKIPKEIQPKSRPSAVCDLASESEIRKNIAGLSQEIANLLCQHANVTQRLGIRHFECDPLDLIEKANNSSRDNKYLEGREEEFEHLQMRKGYSMNQSNSLAQFMDEISRLAGEPDRSLLPAVIKLGISSAKSDYHFYSAFSNWLSENIEEYGGVIPNKFKLTDNCWATLMTCLTYKDVLEKSVQMSRTRAVDHKDKLLSQTPRFDFDKLFESWEKNNI